MTILPRAAVPPAEWDAFVAAHPQGWVWHTYPWLDYLAAAGRRDESFAVYTDDHLVGLCPALLPVPPDDPLPVPLGEVPPVSWPTRGQPQRDRTASGFETRIIDLSLPLDALWAGLRRSSHALIHRAEERYLVAQVYWHDLAECYERRPDLPQLNADQWRCLSRLYDRQILRVYGASDRETGEVVGAVGVYVWKGWAYYGHGRTVGGHGVSHLLQWHTIQALKVEGWPHYETGWMAHAGDDEKARQIAHFKSGLGGETWWVPCQP